MSWQATAWAVEQVVGPPARKLLLLILANYADEHGICWPSQETLASNTGMSLDTVQRQTKKLQEAGFLTISRPPKRRGQWQTFVYQLCIATSARPQNAARSEPATPQNAARPGRNQNGNQAAQLCGLNLQEPPREPSRANGPPEAEASPAALRVNERRETTLNRIARRLGPDGWLIIGELSDVERDRLAGLDLRQQLDDVTLRRAVQNAVASLRSSAPPNQSRLL